MQARFLITLPLASLLIVNPSNAALVVQNLSPVTRVVGLLQGLQEKIVQEGKAEEELFQKFVCWAKSVISAKKASNADASSRLDTLNKYVSDLDNGRIELTSERADLEKELEQVHADMELAESMRSKENQDFESAKEEMEKAIDALTAAIDVLNAATAAHKDGVLLGLRGQLYLRSGSRAAEAATLSHAVELGQKFLTKGDAIFLQRLLTGEVPSADWNKLNRPANFKKSYKARSFKIQSVLAKLLETFETNLAEAKGKEQDAQSTFTNLMSSKGAEKSAAQTALSRLDTEKGAAGMSRAESTSEISQLSTQVSDDEGYMGEVERALESKRTEWDTRKSLRAGELEAVSKALAALHSDDARDMFKKSFKSQGYSLLEEDEVSRVRMSRGRAAAAIRDAAHTAHDSRLAKLASHLAAGGHFDDVLSAIDTMLNLLKSEETSDLEKKETCESDRATDTRDAALASRKMDEMTDTITSLQTHIQELTSNIEGKQQEVREIERELAEALQLRTDEHADYLVAKQEDADAKTLVESALSVLTTFYQSNGLMLAQKGQRQPDVVAGQAPPPPPSTWDEPYGGKTGEATGIVKILTMIKEDIEKDLSTAATEESEAEGLYNRTKTALDTDAGNLNSLIGSLEITKGQKEQSVTDTTGERGLKQGSLVAVMRKISAANPGCTFFTVNFPVRSKNRQAEIDGLLKAKAILSGAEFATPEDPTREIRPGDAFLQHIQRVH
mmetsp:Transcript_111090/g.324947  ORF Transcript_111090/g.324947 Transcript_111090/m.324947 type:complete len:730 (-) Transcript_111090:47-2236(-)